MVVRWLSATFAASIAVVGTTPTANARLDSSRNLWLWAQRNLEVCSAPANMNATPSKTYDVFAGADRAGARRSYASPAAGTFIETAGRGSRWRYDRVHGIAAAIEYGDVIGGVVLDAPPPPEAVVSQDLSHIVSARGLRLGLSSARIAKILGVATSVVKATGAGGAVLYVRSRFACGGGKYTCAHDETVIFKHDRAVAMSLVDLGP